MVNIRKSKIYLLKFISIIILLTLFTNSLEKKKTKIAHKNKSPDIQNYNPFELVFKYIEPDKFPKRSLESIKSRLSNISIIIKKLFYTNISLKETVISERKLKKFKINYDPSDKILIPEIPIPKTHLIVIVSFAPLEQGEIAKSTSFPKSGEEDNDNNQYDDDNSDDDYKKPQNHICNLASIIINSKIHLKKLKFPEEFEIKILREIFYIMGFRRPFLRRQEVRNNFPQVPEYLVENLSSFKTNKKWLELTDQEYKEVSYIKNGDFYKKAWSEKFLINDIMAKSNKRLRKSLPDQDMDFSELTMNLFEDMKIYSINKCEFFKYKAGFGGKFSCTMVNQKCIDYDREIKKRNKYFLFYGTFNKNEIKCYLSNKKNILNNQCGTIYGSLSNLRLERRFCPAYSPIKAKPPLKNHLPIPEIDNYESIKLKLIKKSKYCPIYSPRAIFFSVPKTILDQIKYNISSSSINEVYNYLDEYNKDVKYDEVIIDEEDKKFFPTYLSLEEAYARESVMEVMNNSNVIRSFSQYNSHNLHMKVPVNRLVGDLPRFQKISTFINHELISHKDKTYRQYSIMKELFPEDYNFIPETFFYPESKMFIENKFKNYKIDTENLWLIKPKDGSLGNGIKIFTSLSNIPNEFLITKYINHPHLINGYKYDFRVYVLVTGLAPLKIYLYKEGLARFASEKYSLDKNFLKENYRHLTNISLNKKNKHFKIAHDIDTEEGNRWSLLAYEKYCKLHGIDYQNIRNQMKDIAIKILLAGHKEYYKRIVDSGLKTRNFFHLAGFDFLLDDNFRLFFLEGNDRPSLLMGDINDRKLKPQLVADVLNIVGIVPYSHDYKDNFIAYDLKDKKYFNKYYKLEGEHERIMFDVEESLCEFGRPRGRFELIFPLKENIKKYKKFFRVDLQENNLFWEKIMSE